MTRSGCLPGALGFVTRLDQLNLAAFDRLHPGQRNIVVLAIGILILLGQLDTISAFQVIDCANVLAIGS